MSTLFCQLPGESRFAVLFLGYAAPERASEGGSRRTHRSGRGASHPWGSIAPASLSATMLPKPALSGAEGAVERGVEGVVRWAHHPEHSRRIVIDGVGVGDPNRIFDFRFTIVDL